MEAKILCKIVWCVLCVTAKQKERKSVSCSKYFFLHNKLALSIMSPCWFIIQAFEINYEETYIKQVDNLFSLKFFIDKSTKALAHSPLNTAWTAKRIKHIFFISFLIIVSIRTTSVSGFHNYLLFPDYLYLNCHDHFLQMGYYWEAFWSCTNFTIIFGLLFSLYTLFGYLR